MNNFTVAVFGTLDTKAEPFAYLAEVLKSLDIRPIMIDLGVYSGEEISADYRNADVAGEAGYTLKQIRAMDRSEAIAAMGTGAAKLIRRLCDNGVIQGAISLGGGQGSFLAGMVMRNLPIGLPKLILSTAATRAAAHFAGINDTMIMNSLADVAGRNPLLDMTIRKAAHALCGLLQTDRTLPADKSRKRVGITMWGVTTACVERIRERLEEKGADVYIFHANSIGGPTMESLVEDGFLDAVADVTLNELTSGRIAGEFQNETRLTSAPKHGIPLVVVPGGVDMVNIGVKYAGAPIDARFAGRALYEHNPVVVFARSTAEENRKFAADIAELLNQAVSPVWLLLPRGGTSDANKPGAPFWEPEVDRVLFDTLKQLCGPMVRIIETEYHINDTAFADQAADILIEQLYGGNGPQEAACHPQ